MADLDGGFVEMAQVGCRLSRLLSQYKQVRVDETERIDYNLDCWRQLEIRVIQTENSAKLYNVECPSLFNATWHVTHDSIKLFYTVMM